MVISCKLKLLSSVIWLIFGILQEQTTRVHCLVGRSKAGVYFVLLNSVNNKCDIPSYLFVICGPLSISWEIRNVIFISLSDGKLFLFLPMKYCYCFLDGVDDENCTSQQIRIRSSLCLYQCFPYLLNLLQLVFCLSIVFVIYICVMFVWNILYDCWRFLTG